MQELLGILQIFLPFEQLSEPGKSLNVADLKIFPFLIAPVGGNPFFGYSVHFMSPDLNFDSLTVGTNHASMQRLIHVGFRDRNVVFEPSWNRAPLGMNHAEGFVTLPLRIDQNAKRYQIIDLIVKQILALHLLINAIEMLRPAADFGVDTFGVELFGDD